MKQFYALLFTLIFFVATQGISQENSRLPQAISYLEKTSENWGLSKDDIKSMVTSSEMFSKKSGIHYVYLQQTVNGVPIQNAIVTISIGKKGNLVHASHNLSKNIESRVSADKPTITMEDALVSSVQHLSLQFKTTPVMASRDNNGNPVFSWDEVVDTDITPTLKYVEQDGKLVLVWNFDLDLVANADYWNMNINATDGSFVRKDNMTVYCSHHKDTYAHQHDCKIKTFRKIEKDQVSVSEALSSSAAATYNVYKLPAECPNHGPRQIVTDGEFPEASPFGWHDTDGVEGAEYTITRGNNVYAFEDKNNDDASDGNDPDGGANLVFDFPMNLNNDPRESGNAAVTNLFYMNNMIHDITHFLGFDEAAGNFQARNYTGAPGGGDFVLAQALDGIEATPQTLNNANFATPSDGGNGRMQMFLWENGGGAVSIDSPDAIKGFVKEYGTGQFGGVIPNATQPPITGQVAIGRDNSSNPSACCNNLANTAEVAGKIVMVDRGGCDFSRKVYRAQTAGAIAVIVCNVVGVSGGNGEEVLGMSGASFSDLVTIPSVFFKKSDCDKIRVSLSEGNVVTMTFQVREREGAEFLDGSLDNGIIAHEFAHGISNRLTGGRIASTCLTNDEQMGEGWSDFFSLILTHEPGDKGSDIRGIGTFAQNQSVEGGGIRRFPYSTDMSINPQTFDNIKGTEAPHPLGEVWTGMLWDMYWKFVDLYGYDGNWKNENSGNFKGALLVMEGMKLQPCNPGFIQGRDAILAADREIFDGLHQCMIWDVFARRGLGYLAEGGDRDNRNDGVQNFESLPTCTATLKIKKEMSKKLVQPGDEIDVTLTINNHFAQKEPNVIVTDELQSGLTYVAGSGSIVPTVNGNVLTFNIGEMDYDTERKITYKVRSSITNKSTALFVENFENDIAWDLVTEEGAETWLPNYDVFRSAETSMYIPNFEAETDASIISLYDINVIGQNPALRFWHLYNTELTNDGGFVEISVDGAPFRLVPRDKFIANPYNTEIAYGTLAIPSLFGFSGSSDNKWVDSYIDLSEFRGKNIKLKFRFGTNATIAPTTENAGWHVDDIELMDLFIYDTKACISSPNNQVCAEIEEVIVDSDGIVNAQDETFDYFNMSLVPNPASDYVVVRTDFPIAQKVDISVFSLDGREISTISKVMNAGQNIETLSTASWAKGVYMVTLKTESSSTTQKLVITY